MRQRWNSIKSSSAGWPTIGWVSIALALPAVASAQAVAPAAIGAPSTIAATADDPRLGWRSARWGTLVGGSIALAIGALAFSEGLSDEAAIEDAERDADGVIFSLSQREALRVQDSASRFKTMGAVSMGVGVGLLATGVVLWLLEPDAPAGCADVPAEPEVRPFSFAPTFGPDGPGFGFAARF